MAAGGGLVYYLTVIRPKQRDEITNPDEIDTSERMKFLERAICEQEARQRAVGIPTYNGYGGV